MFRTAATRIMPVGGGLPARDRNGPMKRTTMTNRQNPRHRRRIARLPLAAAAGVLGLATATGGAGVVVRDNEQSPMAQSIEEVPQPRTPTTICVWVPGIGYRCTPE
jgi:hypothetical protein